MAEKCSILAVEPIEKRPFFHYNPGSKYLAVGFYGCSFACKFCQNFQVSQSVNGSFSSHSPSGLKDIVLQKSVSGIAFTFNEPTIHCDFIAETAQLGVDVVVKTNGFVNPDVLKYLGKVSAWNIDIKGDDNEYRRVCDGWLQPVLNSIEFVAKSSSHLEISYLVLPRLASDWAYHRKMRDFIADLNPEIPVHILNFYPFHDMLENGYDSSILKAIIGLFQERLRYVYVSNSFSSDLIEYRNTFCPSCKSELVNRNRGTKVNSLCCCGHRLKIVGGISGQMA